MRCAEVQEQLSTYDYGGGSHWSRWRIQHHLARCPACTRERVLLRRTAEVLREVPERAVPEQLWERIGTAIETETAPPPERAKTKSAIPRWRWAPAGFAVAAAFLMGFGLFWFLAPEPEAPDVFDNPTPYMRYHHLLAHQEVLADAAGLDMLATTVHYEAGNWK